MVGSREPTNRGGQAPDGAPEAEYEGVFEGQGLAYPVRERPRFGREALEYVTGRVEDPRRLTFGGADLTAEQQEGIGKPLQRDLHLLTSRRVARRRGRWILPRPEFGRAVGDEDPLASVTIVEGLVEGRALRTVRRLNDNMKCVSHSRSSLVLSLTWDTKRTGSVPVLVYASDCASAGQIPFSLCPKTPDDPFASSSNTTTPLPKNRSLSF